MHDTRSARQQKGATLVFVALWMGIALAGLMVLDIGNLFWQKRELQKIADLSALAGASGNLDDCHLNALAVAKANGLTNSDPDPIVHLGSWNGKISFDDFLKTSSGNACGISVGRSVPYFFIWPASAGSSRELFGKAIAVKNSRLARLSIRSGLASIDSAKSPLLNPLIGALLGGKLNLNVASWEGLIGADIELLKFLNLLAPKVGVGVGNYDELLTTNVSVGTLIDVMIDAVEKDGNFADAAIQALGEVARVGVKVKNIGVQLGDLLGIQNGTADAGLKTNINPLNLLQATLQLANYKHAAQLDLDTSDLGLGNVLGLAVRLRIIDPPKISAIGDPYLAGLDPLGKDSIYVRVAQIRLLLSMDIPLLTGLVNGIFNTLGWLVDLKINILPDARLDLSLEAGGGSVYVTGYSCAAGSKELHTRLRTSLGDLRIGRMGNNAADAAKNVLGSQVPIANSAIPLLRIGCQHCVLQGIGSGPKPQAYGGLGIKLDLPVAAYDVSPFIYENPPEIFEADPEESGKLKLTEPLWRRESTKNIINSLAETLNAVSGLLVSLPATSKNLLGLVIDTVTKILEELTQGLGAIVTGLLSPLLDPIINSLLHALGIDLAKTEAGAQLNCGGGAELVY